VSDTAAATHNIITGLRNEAGIIQLYAQR